MTRVLVLIEGDYNETSVERELHHVALSLQTANARPRQDVVDLAYDMRPRFFFSGPLTSPALTGLLYFAGGLLQSPGSGPA